MRTEAASPIYMLTISQVVQRTGLSRSSIYSRINPASRFYDPTFPKQIRLSLKGSAVRWNAAAVNAWLEQCIDASGDGMQGSIQ